MTDAANAVDTARELLTRPVPPGAKARVLRQLEASADGRRSGLVRLPVLVLAVFVTTTAAAVGYAVAPRWLHPSTNVRPTPTGAPAEQSKPRAAKRREATRPVFSASPVPGPDLPIASASSAALLPPRAPSAARAIASSAVAEDAESALAQQVAAYREAVALVDTSPALAVVRLRAFKDRWPDSPLGEEASVRLIQALVGLGRPDDARHFASAFLKRYPGSAKRADMEALVSTASDQ